MLNILLTRVFMKQTALWKHIHGKHFYNKFGLGYVRGKNYKIYHECEDVSEKFFVSSTLGITRRDIDDFLKNLS